MKCKKIMLNCLIDPRNLDIEKMLSDLVFWRERERDRKRGRERKRERERKKERGRIGAVAFTSIMI